MDNLYLEKNPYLLISNKYKTDREQFQKIWNKDTREKFK